MERRVFILLLTIVLSIVTIGVSFNLEYGHGCNSDQLQIPFFACYYTAFSILAITGLYKL